MEQKKTWKERMERLKDSYQLIIRNTDTFHDIVSYNLTILNFYILFSILFLIMGLLSYLLLVYTPMARLLPHYGETTTLQNAYELNQKLTKLEAKASAQSLYIQKFQELLSGNVDTTNFVFEMEDTTSIATSEAPQRVVEDDELRMKVDLKNESLLTSSRLDKAMNPDLTHFVPPVSGHISANYDPKIDHLGIDIGASKDSPIRCIKNGVIIFADWTLETGYTIGVQHSSSLISFYKHNSALLKKIGQNVNSGEAIAIIGNSGTLSSGPHLHFELWYDGKAVNPLEYIKF